ncbi:MAG: rhodanese-like domain-containing protein [Myxococcales bacterium]
MPRQITVDELARMLTEGAPLILLDVRQPWEHEMARLPDSLLIPLPELGDRAAEVAPPAGTLVVAYCHHGVRSLGAAAFLEAHGVNDVASLAGGIDAWSRHIDPAIPRY